MRDAKLFDEHIPRLRRYARALTSDHGQADDLVQAGRLLLRLSP